MAEPRKIRIDYSVEGYGQTHEGQFTEEIDLSSLGSTPRDTAFDGVTQKLEDVVREEFPTESGYYGHTVTDWNFMDLGGDSRD